MSALAKPLDRLSHVIGEMVVDFGIHSSDSGARDPDDLAWQVRQDLLPAIEAAIESVAADIPDLSLDHLEIDLGQMPATLDWPRIRQLVQDQLSRALRERAALSGAGNPPSDTHRRLTLARSNMDEARGASSPARRGGPRPSGIG